MDEKFYAGAQADSGLWCKGGIKVMGGLILIAVMWIILLNTVFTGWKNYFYTEGSLSRIAERLLEKKYDEEFIIHDVWTEE